MEREVFAKLNVNGKDIPGGFYAWINKESDIARLAANLRGEVEKRKEISDTFDIDFDKDNVVANIYESVKSDKENLEGLGKLLHTAKL